MTAPINPTNVSQTQNTNNTAPANPPQNSGAPANTQSTLSSAANEQRPGVFAQIKNVFCKFLSSIRNCLSHIPLIGRLFKSSEEGASVTGNENLVVSSDADRLNLIKASLVENGSTASAPILADAVVNEILTDFAAITDPVVKAKAFHAIVNASNSTDVMAKDAFNQLPDDAKAAFKGHCFAANGNSSVLNGHDHGMGFGDHVAHEAPRSDVAIRAAAAWVAALETPAQPPVPPPVPPTPSTRQQLRDLFNKITALNSDPAAVRAAYNGLSVDVKNAIKAQIYRLNGNSDIHGVDATTGLSNNYQTFFDAEHGHGLGARVVAQDMGNRLFERAVRNVLQSIV